MTLLSEKDKKLLNGFKECNSFRKYFSRTSVARACGRDWLVYWGQDDIGENYQLDFDGIMIRKIYGDRFLYLFKEGLYNGKILLNITNSDDIFAELKQEELYSLEELGL